jgi:RHS repeat-associated protein
MLRAPSRSPLAQLIARVLVVALVAAAIPVDATASLPVGEVSKLTKSAFGELLGHTGTDPQPYAFTGEPYDPNVGFQYHRARWMDSRVGRFLGVDPFSGYPTVPSSLHKYLYGAADPLNMIDPSGLEGVMSLSIGSGIRQTISATALVNAVAATGTVLLTLVAADFVVSAIASSQVAQAALEQERVKVKAKVEEAVRANPSPVLFHYTHKVAALQIAASGFIIATPAFRMGGFTFPPGAYATELPPFLATMSQRDLSALFYGGNEGRDVAWFVMIQAPDFIRLSYAPVPNQWYRPAPPLAPVPVEVLLVGPNLMLP